MRIIENAVVNVSIEPSIYLSEAGRVTLHDSMQQVIQSSKPYLKLGFEFGESHGLKIIMFRAIINTNNFSEMQF